MTLADEYELSWLYNASVSTADCNEIIITKVGKGPEGDERGLFQCIMKYIKKRVGDILVMLANIVPNTSIEHYNIGFCMGLEQGKCWILGS